MPLPVTAADARSAADDRLAVLFDVHHRRLWRLARRMVGDGEEARDLVQDCFLRAARHLGRLPPGEAAAEAWLVRALVNLCRDRRRRRRVRREHHHDAVASPAAGPAAAADPEAAAVARATMERVLSALPPRRRAVLLFAEIEGLPAARIAALLGIGQVTVRWHLAKARADLAAALAASGPRKEEAR
ncbi:MAG TPA: RNA polymerase sigma factor [Thermoanaerobaculia bacterium]